MPFITHSPKVLVVAYYFPPIAVSGSIRPAAFCKYLPEFSWEPSVLTTDGLGLDPPLPIDQELSKDLPDSLHIERVRHLNPNQSLLRLRDRFERLFSFSKQVKYSGASGFSGERTSKSDTRPKRRMFLRKMLDMFLEELLIFPDPQRFWRGPAIHHVRRLPKEQYPDLVFATGGPWTSLLVGATLAEDFQVPFVADFRDPWVDNPYWEASSQRLYQRARELERWVCEKATTVVLNTEELAEAFRKRYPTISDRFVAITNGFERSILRPIRPPRPAGSEHRLYLSHFGTVYGKRNPEPLLEAVTGLIQDDPSLTHRLVLNFVGRWEIAGERCESLARRLEAMGVLIRMDKISRDACLDQMAHSKLLLILQPEAPLQVPAKMYEYIAMRRPVVVIGGEGATAGLVQRYGLGISCSNRPDSIKELIGRILTGDVELSIPSERDVLKFDYRSLTARLADVFSAAHYSYSGR